MPEDEQEEAGHEVEEKHNAQQQSEATAAAMIAESTNSRAAKEGQLY